MKELEKMTDDRRVGLAMQRTREVLLRQATESCRVGGESLSELYRRAEPMSYDTRKSRQRIWFRVAAPVVLVAVSLGLMASLGIGGVQPTPHGNAMNLSADRANAIVSINHLLEKL